MKSRLRKRLPRGLCHPDLVYAGVVALIICIGLIARGTAFCHSDDVNDLRLHHCRPY